MPLVGLSSFVRDRLGQVAEEAVVFHVLVCDPAVVGVGGCECGCRGRLEAVGGQLRRVDAYEARLCGCAHGGVGWPWSAVDAGVDLMCMALPYELHPLWREEWRP